MTQDDVRAELLLRHVHPNNMPNGIPSRIALMPSAVDEGQLSVDRQRILEEEASYRLRTAQPPDGFGRRSAGIVRLDPGAIDEVEKDVGKSIRRYAKPEPAKGGLPANPAHAQIDMSLDEKVQRDIARKLILVLLKKSDGIWTPATG